MFRRLKNSLCWFFIVHKTAIIFHLLAHLQTGRQPFGKEVTEFTLFLFEPSTFIGVDRKAKQNLPIRTNDL